MIQHCVYRIDKSGALIHIQSACTSSEVDLVMRRNIVKCMISQSVSCRVSGSVDSHPSVDCEPYLYDTLITFPESNYICHMSIRNISNPFQFWWSTADHPNSMGKRVLCSSPGTALFYRNITSVNISRYHFVCIMQYLLESRKWICFQVVSFFFFKFDVS